jgi:hypothetical protein
MIVQFEELALFGFESILAHMPWSKLFNLFCGLQGEDCPESL